MSGFPYNRRELLRASYRRTGQGVCKGCAAPIEWWTTTHGKSIPMDPMPEERSPAVAHFTTCPKAKDFQGPSLAGPGADLGREVRALRERTQARVVVLVSDTGTVAAWASNIPAEDLRHDLISAANFVRNAVLAKEAGHG